MRTLLINVAVGLAVLIAFITLTVFLTPCVEEDSSMCYWNASIRGNGLGQSFVTLWDGFTIYVGIGK